MPFGALAFVVTAWVVRQALAGYVLARPHTSLARKFGLRGGIGYLLVVVLADISVRT